MIVSLGIVYSFQVDCDNIWMEVEEFNNTTITPGDHHCHYVPVRILTVFVQQEKQPQESSIVGNYFTDIPYFDAAY